MTEQTVALCPPDVPSRRIVLLVEDRPGDEWIITAVPADSGWLDDPARTPRQVAVEVAAEARAAAEAAAYEQVIVRRRNLR